MQNRTYILCSNLEKGMWRNLHHHSIVWHKIEALLEQHRAHQVVDMILSRGVERQWALPVCLRDRGADPAS